MISVCLKTSQIKQKKHRNSWKVSVEKLDELKHHLLYF
jgi:hypothetical protein